MARKIGGAMQFHSIVDARTTRIAASTNSRQPLS